MLLRDNFSMTAVVLWMTVLIFSLSVHEFAHAWTAWKSGDDTAARMGRLTLNPLAHLDFLGTIMILFAPIGWAKPVPVNPSRFKKPRRDEILVSMAGPASNIVIAMLAGLGLRGLTMAHGNLLQAASGGVDLFAALAGALSLLVFLNFALAFFNLIPIFPLDGSHVLENLLPLEAQMRYREIRPYLPFVLLALIFFTPVLSYLIIVPLSYLAPLLTGYSLNALFHMVGAVTS
ncbi:MAG: site-2 protease family protein [Deltaproteobacteria bacterium]|nr:site-2 protease family protein [Deltaproteobacteria bacterium]